jgi:hypothetical protein
MAAQGPVNPDTALYIAIFFNGVKSLFLGVAIARLAEPRCLSDGKSESSAQRSLKS